MADDKRTADDESADAVSFTYDPDEDYEPLITIVRAVAWANGVDIDDLEPLGNVVNTDALLDLLTHDSRPTYRHPTEAQSEDPGVSFQYEGHTVWVGGGVVRLE